MANRVNYTNLFTEVRNNVVDLVKDNSNITDPITTSTEYRKWVYSREPDIKASGFKGYPFIIVHPAIVRFGEEAETTVDGKSQEVNWIIEIEVVTSDRGYGTDDGRGQEYLDEISNDLVKTFFNQTNQNILRANGLYFIKPDSTGRVIDYLHNELVYRRTFMLGFKTQMQVCA